MTRAIIACLLSATTLLFLFGCPPQHSPSHPRQVIEAQDTARDTAGARMHNEAAQELIEHGNLNGAEKELKVALAADALYGPTYNTYGMLYYRQKNYQEAASKFSWAAQLMPKSGAPRNNLGLVYEAVGRFDDAAASYQDAMVVDPSSIEITANLARVLVRLGRTDDRTRKLLNDIVMRDTRDNWVNWARERLAIMGISPASSTSKPAMDAPKETKPEVAE